MRILDRLASANRPKLVVIDPRTTETAQAADVHLAPRLGTNMALLNGLQHLLVAGGHVDRAYVNRYTVGFEALERMVAKWTPERVREVTGVGLAELRNAADIIGQSASLVSTVLQGVYQSHQATAAAVQVNIFIFFGGSWGSPAAPCFR